MYLRRSQALFKTPPGSVESKLVKKYISALVFTDAPYFQHEENYGDGHILEFDFHYKTECKCSTDY